MVFMMIRLRFSHTQSCGFTGFQDTHKFRPEIMSLATGLTILAVLAYLSKHSGSHWRFQFLASILDGFFEFLVLNVNEINSSQSSGIVELSFFNCPFMLLPQLSISCQFRLEFWPSMTWPGCQLFSHQSPRTTYIRLEVCRIN